MSRVIAFHVAGTPAPKGSMRAFTVPLGGGRVGARVIPDNRPQSRAWIALVADAARQARGEGDLFVGVPLRLEAVFALARPAGHYGKRGLKPGAPIAPAGKPDADKLARQVGDALKGVLFDDDARIVQYHADKVYALEGQATGLALWLWPVTLLEVTAAQDRYASLAGAPAARRDHHDDSAQLALGVGP